MNAQPVDSAPVMVAARSEPSKLLRLGRFLFLAIPGAWLVGTCGTLMITAIAHQRDAWFYCLLAWLMIVGAGLLLYGTRTRNEPLFLLVIIPMPILISLGYRLGYLGHDAGFLVTILGMTWPMIAYRPISRFYKRRATKLALEPSGSASAVPA